MLRRSLAAVAGALVAVGAYGFVQPDGRDAPIAHAAGFGVPLPDGDSVPRTVPRLDRTPVRLVITDIGVDANVEARGLDADRNLEAPGDYHDVAWYRLGPRPGEPGNAILNGHVSWWTGRGVFADLGRVRPGALIQLVRADGFTVAFKVTGRRTVPAGARIASLFAPDSHPTLTLITCSGTWDPLTRSDTERLLVSATLV